MSKPLSLQLSQSRGANADLLLCARRLPLLIPTGPARAWRRESQAQQVAGVRWVGLPWVPRAWEGGKLIPLAHP